MRSVAFLDPPDPFPAASIAGRRRLWAATAAVGLLSVGASMFAWHDAGRIGTEKAHAVFDLRATEIARNLAGRIDDYSQVLRGARGFLAAAPGIGSREWHAYVRELHVGTVYLGFESAKLVRVVRRDEVADYVAERRRDPQTPDFVWRGADRPDEWSLLTLVEPATPQSAMTIGIDVGADPVRRAAFERARDTDSPSISGRVELLVAPTPGRANVILYVPIYRPARPAGSVDERRRAIWGYVGAAVRIDRMVAGIISEIDHNSSSDITRGLTFDIRDVTDPAEPRELYSGTLAPGGPNGPYFAKQVPIDVAGRRWSVDFASLPSSLPAEQGTRPMVVALIVGLIGALLTVLTYSLGTLWLSRRRLHRTNLRLRRREEELHRLAVSDPLTGLANRRRFNELGTVAWSRARRHGRPLALLMIDVDHFKAINDTHGHAVGDETLRLLVGGVRGLLRDCDLFARIGGEEFAVVLPETEQPAAEVVADRVRQAASQLVVPTDRAAVSLTISIGLAVDDDADTGLADLVKRADHALYAAKRAGRNRVVLADAVEYQW